MMHSKNKCIYFLLGFLICMTIFAGTIACLDPFFLYHRPLKGYYYTLDNERSQNRGIIKYFSYDGIITGTSVTENFRTTEFDSYFGTKSIKVPYSGATFNEAANGIRAAYATGHELKYVLRSLDLNHITEDKNSIRTDLGEYPEYLYNQSILDDYKYLLNKEILLDYCFPMMEKKILGESGGITTFDDYSTWRGTSQSGKAQVLSNIKGFSKPAGMKQLTAAEQTMLLENIRHNITSLAEEHPETTFLYFVPPYNVAWWGEHYSSGDLDKISDAEKTALSAMLKYSNIRIYLFTRETDLTTDLDRYVDTVHYNDSVNSQILTWIHENRDLLTDDNIDAYLSEQRDFYGTYDYKSLLNK